MKPSIFHKLSSILWGALVLLIVLLAIYVSVGRMLSSLTGAYQREILRELNLRVPFLLDADRVSAEWHSFSPVLVLGGLRLTLPGDMERSIELSEGRITFDVAQSLLSRSLQMTQLRLDGLNLAGRLDEEGALHFRGFDSGDTQLGERLEQFLSNVERVALGAIHLELLLVNGDQRGFDLDLALSRDGSRRRLEGTLSSSGGLKVFALGEGVGNPFKPESFTGQLYLDIEADDVGAVTDLMGDMFQQQRVVGGLGLALWLSWERGVPESVVRLKMTNALVSAVDAPWQMSFERLVLDARLESRDEGWLLNIADLELARDELLLQLPRLQLDLRGETLNLRTQGFALGPLAELLAGSAALGPATTDVLGVLRPRGNIAALQVNVTDISTLEAGWQVLANFDEVAVDSWKGAPGVGGGRGYAEFTPGAGLVVVDSQPFEMTFPSVYTQPLNYSDFHGSIRVAWDEEVVQLSSGLVEAQGEEGPVPVVFGLTIPLVPSDVGLEMDLLVGLRNTPADLRTKYIPYILDEQLRSWLSTSIGDGLIAEGGFLWRGSLTSDSAALHTTQLFFDIRDTKLTYHRDWPALADIDGSVLIDDGNVSVWATEASLLDSQVEALSVEVWTDEAERMWLAVDGKLAGPSADGLAVVNNSPLRTAVGDIFTDWQLTGELGTHFELLLNLSDSSVPPQVTVSAKFAGAGLDIRPGDVSLREIHGVLDYDTKRGFSSRDLVGQLWGRPLQASVEQRPAEAQPGGTVTGSAVTVAISGTVDMSDVRQWLDLDLLRFADGQAEATVAVRVGAQQSPTLSINSALQGVSLDLPAPWGKVAGVDQQLEINLALGGEGLLLDLQMADGPQLALQLAEGKLQAASLAFATKPLALQTGQLRISGHGAYADTAEWQRFLTDYFVASPEPSGPPELSENGRHNLPLTLSIEQLLVDHLLIGERDLGAVRLGLLQEVEQWRLTADAPWLRGELIYVDAGGSRLDIAYLDLAGLESPDLESPAVESPAVDSGEMEAVNEDALDKDAVDKEVGEETDIVELPELAVVIQELRRADLVLGDLAFNLHSEGPDIIAQRITGDIAAMQLRPEEPGELTWHQGSNSRTTMQAHLDFQDLGQTLKRLGYQEVVVTENGSFDIALEWPGGPQDFSLRQGKGSLRVDIGQGHFPQAAAGAAGTLRVVSILNLADIVRRLSLTQMFESGIPFNEVDGEVFLHAGTIEVANMEVQGTASSFQFSGVSDVSSRSLDGELVVTLPVASNLPWVAALTAGLPVAAGVFVLSKVFKSQFNRLTSAVYTATGTWDEPDVKFDRVFDDTTVGGAGATQPEGAPPVVVPQTPVPPQREIIQPVLEAQ